MSSTAQMKDNLSYMKDFRPLDEAEQRIIQQAQRILGNSSTIPCTACHYCTEGCPKKIAIPEMFTAMNKRLGNGQLQEAADDYRNAISCGGRASDCIGCGKCEQVCPQHLPMDYIYVNELGERIKPNYITQHFPLVLQKNGMRKIRFHDGAVIITLNQQSLGTSGVRLI